MQRQQAEAIAKLSSQQRQAYFAPAASWSSGYPSNVWTN